MCHDSWIDWGVDAIIDNIVIENAIKKNRRDINTHLLLTYNT